MIEIITAELERLKGVWEQTLPEDQKQVLNSLKAEPFGDLENVDLNPLLDNVVISNDTLAYFPLSEHVTLTDFLGEKIRFPHVVKCSLTKPLPGKYICIDVPEGHVCIVDDKAVYLNKGTVVKVFQQDNDLLHGKIVPEGNYFVRMSNPHRIQVPRGASIKPFNICKKYQEGDYIPIDDLKFLKNKKLKDQLVSHPVNTEDYLDYLSNKTLNPEVQYDLIKDLHHNTGPVLSQAKHTLQELRRLGLRRDQYDPMPELEGELQDPNDKKLEPEVQPSYFYAFDVKHIPEEQRLVPYYSPMADPFVTGKPRKVTTIKNEEGKEEEIPIDIHDVRINPEEYALTWASNESLAELRQQIENNELPINGKGRGRSNYRFLRKLLKELPKSAKAGEKVPPALQRLIVNKILGGKQLKNYKKILVNTNLRAHRGGMWQKIDDSWGTTTHSFGKNQKERAALHERVKNWLTAVNIDGKDATRHEHYLHHLEGLIRSYDNELDPIIAETNKAYEDYSKKPNDTKLLETWSRAEKRLSEAKRTRNILAAQYIRMSTGIRPGNNERSLAAGKAILGTNTLQGRNVIPSGDASVTFDFTGKAGKPHDQRYYDNPGLHYIMSRLKRENNDYALRHWDRVQKSGEAKHNGQDLYASPADLADSMPLLTGTHDASVNKRIIHENTGHFLRKLGFPEEHIEDMANYDDRRTAFNAMAHDFAKNVAEATFKRKEAERPLVDHTLGDKEGRDLSKHVFEILSQRTNNAPHTLENNYIIPGLVHNAIHYHFNRMKKEHAQTWGIPEINQYKDYNTENSGDKANGSGKQN